MKHRILLVEDEKKTGELLKRALEQENIDVVWSTDGNSALKEIQKGRFGLIVLDLKLPGITGDEVLEHIRKIDPYVEVVVYTNYEDPPVMKKLINLGVDGYINKGADADLWNTVKIIKEKLDPFTSEEVECLRQSLPEDLFKINEKENGV
jgi:DNA-binding response OmpR family regulator